VSDDEVFVVKLEPSMGDTSWDLQLNGSGDQHAGALAADGDGQFWLVGSFTDRIAIPGKGELAAVHETDGFYVKLAANGSLSASGTLGGAYQDRPRAVALDALGNATVVGQFELELELTADSSLEALGALDAFVVKLGPDGSHLWAQAFGGSLADDAVAVASDAAGMIAVVGDFEASMWLGEMALQSVGDSDVFVALFSP
jgi:hypothetical protein